MKYIFINLKRFDVPVAQGGINRTSMQDFAKEVLSCVQDIKGYTDMQFAFFFPEAHLFNAVEQIGDAKNVAIGCQSVFRVDVERGENFGSLTTNRPAQAAKALGCTWTLIGHCEERRDKLETIMAIGDVDVKKAKEAVNRLLNRQVQCAVKAGLNVLYCVGESLDEQADIENLLTRQVEIGLQGVEKSHIAVAYEPLWAIGPGKTPPDRAYIEMVSLILKKAAGDVPVLYGGGLKEENAAMLALIPTIDGGLVALTRFSGDIGFYPDEFVRIVKKYRGESV